MNQGYLKISVLRILSGRDMSGYDLMKEINSMIGIKPSPGSLYPLLKDLKEKKLIQSRDQNRKIIYSITKKGKKTLAEMSEKRKDVLKVMEKNINFMDKVICGKNSGGVIKILKRVIKGELPFSTFTHEMINFRDTMVDISGRKLTEKQRKKILSTIKKATEEVRKHAAGSN